MDAFAVAVCIGLALREFSFKKALIVGLYFGVFQAGMPVIGYLVASLFSDSIIAYDHWVAFVLLGFLGVRMVLESFKKEDHDVNKPDAQTALTPKKMIPLAVATSIDAMAVGVSFAFLKVNIVSAVAFIGVTTLVISAIGVKIGCVFGVKFKSKAEFAGGIILIAIGVKILLEHTLFGG